MKEIETYAGRAVVSVFPISRLFPQLYLGGIHLKISSSILDIHWAIPENSVAERLGSSLHGIPEHLIRQSLAIDGDSCLDIVPSTRTVGSEDGSDAIGTRDLSYCKLKVTTVLPLPALFVIYSAVGGSTSA